MNKTCIQCGNSNMDVLWERGWGWGCKNCGIYYWHDRIGGKMVLVKYWKDKVWIPIPEGYLLVLNHEKIST